MNTTTFNLLSKLLGRPVKNIPTNNPVKMQSPINGVAGQIPPTVGQYGVMAQQPTYQIVNGGGLVGGIAPNFGNGAGSISVSGTMKSDPDSAITGVPAVYRMSLGDRNDEEAESYYGDDFKLEDEIFLTTFDINVGKNEFHFLVWKAIWGETTRDYGFVMLMPKQTLLAFTSRESRDQFVSWFEAYQQRYPDRNTKDWRVPSIRQGRTGGCFADRKPLSEAEVVKIWAWIIGHCAGSAAFLPNFILFDNENDAVAYRLRWG
jgi:hypothetical protein